MSEVKGKVEQKRVKGRNMHDVVNQIVTDYHSGNGWAVVRVSPMLLNFEVLLERSVDQNQDNIEDAEVVSKDVVPSDEKSTDVKDVVPSDEKSTDVEVEVTPRPPANKKTNTKKATTTTKKAE